ncbi:MAG: hypothetical protein Kow0062_08990 [Acidobacteriota bacterium]
MRCRGGLLAGRPVRGFLALLSFVAVVPFVVADVTPPAEVTGVHVVREGADLRLSWDAVTTDAAGQPETVDHYRIWRGTAPDFVPDKAGGSNEIGTSTTEEFVDLGAGDPPQTYYYLVSAVDAAGLESRTKAPTVTTPPVLSGFWTDTSIELSWTDAQPVDQVTGYRVYYGRRSHQYEFVDDVGMATSHSLTGLQEEVNWYAAVVAVDVNGNESDFSNEHVDAIAGRVRVRAHDESKLCWGAANCPPKPGEIQRSDGWEMIVPVEWPEGDWKSVKVIWTIDSRLCSPPTVPDKCGDGNPGGYNPCGDPWDRTAELYFVLDDCVQTGGTCKTNNNLELIHAVTPFGTDAPPPDGDGVVPPRVYEMDITPYAPLLIGSGHVGARIVHYVQGGWWVTTEFLFSERDDEASPKPPADGIQVLFFGGATPPTATVDIPPTATSVYTRLFTSGHGGNQACDGGVNDGQACTSSAECPGGSCQNCDEFCHRLNQIIVDGQPVWEAVPWRDDCSPGSIFACQEWNACGWPSCTFSRAGWCPGYIACHHDAPCDNDLDMTAFFPPGTHTVDYNVTPRNGSWGVSLVLYWYEN